MYPTLLTLPAELRNLVLELLFFDAELSTLCKCHRPSPFQRANYGILAANKQLHREASTILFHGAVLRVGIIKTDALEVDVMNNYTPFLVTKTVVPIWSWYVRDRYRDNGTDLGFLERWHGLKKVRHVEFCMSFKNKFWIDFGAFHSALPFLDSLPEIESLTVYTEAYQLEYVKSNVERVRLPELTKVMVLPMDDVRGHHF